MKTRILITVEKGLIQSVCSNNSEVEILIVDRDIEMSDSDASIVSEILSPDALFENGEAHLLYDENTPEYREIKRLKF